MPSCPYSKHLISAEAGCEQDTHDRRSLHYKQVQPSTTVGMLLPPQSGIICFKTEVIVLRDVIIVFVDISNGCS